MLVRVLLLLASLTIPTALCAEQTAAEKAGFASNLTIYLAKGAPGACGPGCDRWIAIEGEIDANAASRVRRFLAGVKDTQRPIYLHSPGGNVEQSYVIGRLLRSRKAVARVGQTIATACAAGTQVDAACLKAKNAGGEIEAELTTYHAMCNSACGYVFLGATSREVAPDAALGVHNSRLVFAIHGHPPEALLAEFRQRRTASADHERAAYIVAMGISRELDDLIHSVKFENLHMLTRTELDRFNIDKRPLAETMWRLVKGARPYISKFATLRSDNGPSFRTMEWRLYCDSKTRVPLMFAAEIDETASGQRTIMMTADAAPTEEAGGRPLRSGKYEVWSGSLDFGRFRAVMASRALHVRETTQKPDETADTAKFDIDTTGLPSAWTQLEETCPPATTSQKPPWPAIPPPKTTATPSAAPSP
ncbi:hypothetical protein L6654_17795 [Bradyrhizobium sp. WYCCWR 13023]|uniref:Uncharacterized protein n=1 Tax=Bradyrhizobium zhengyangense TaxID=2911009 RepID=A0A9X1R9S8_9BRAD|nr:hypothetical protein [Bradyrhizobium zhengyangense]MCG2628491.1 hypothetical protein [Bradyrhizobium zhengyangense]MCG2640114.1 hypothetical protein [Bradyrhizobium zhengyangense]MCG2665395.1 hypothetical protein [Bradyrhizobium zhengyangense]